MKVIGLTGGIGSGKSTLLRWFLSKGIPCFCSDEVGRELLNSSLQKEVVLRFGTDIYIDDILDRKKLSKIVFGDSQALSDLNKIVHPAVNEAFIIFKSENKNAPFIINESAILFETGGHKKLDKVILSSNQTLIWDSLNEINYKNKIEGFGKLFNHQRI